MSAAKLHLLRGVTPDYQSAWWSACSECGRRCRSDAPGGVCHRCRPKARGEQRRASGERCVHCRERPACRARQMCWTCYYTPGLRGRYRVAHRASRKGEAADFTGPGREPAAATEAAPGSEEKMRVMEDRVSRGEKLHHPQDRKLDLA